MSKKNPLTESFLVQIDVDLEHAGLDDHRSLRSRMARANFDAGVGFAMPACPMATVDATSGKPIKTPAIFGNPGLAVHTSPNEISPVGLQCGHPQGNPYGTQGVANPIAESASFMPSSKTSYMIPHRQSTTGANPSPETVSDEAMDTSTDTNDRSTPSSHPNFSSRVSNTSSFTPPDMHQDNDEQTNWDTQTFEIDRRAVHIPSSQQATNAFFDMTKDSTITTFTELNFDTFATEDGRTGMTPNINNAFTMPNWATTMGDGGTGLTPGFSGGGGTGFTPGPSGDSLMGMSDADWKHMLDTGMLNMVDMGWEGGMPGT